MEENKDGHAMLRTEAARYRPLEENFVPNFKNRLAKISIEFLGLIPFVMYIICLFQIETLSIHIQYLCYIHQ